MIKKATKEDILDWYYWGWEHSSTDAPPIDWFHSELEKACYFQGYEDFEISLVRTKKEIIELLGDFK